MAPSSFPCLYSKQKLKKRKTFSDGRLSVNFATGLCCLYNAPDDRSTSTACLDSVTLTVPQLNRIRNGEELEIDFEQYIATVEQPPPAEKARPLLKVPKFIPPPKVAPAPKVVPDPPAPKILHNTTNGIVRGSGLYDVDDDVIDAFAEDEEKEEAGPVIHQEENFEAAVPEEDGADPWSDNEGENDAPLPLTNNNTNSQARLAAVHALDSKQELHQAQPQSQSKSQSQPQPQNQDVWAEDNVIESPAAPAAPAENEEDIWGF